MITILILIMVAYFPSPKKLKFDHIKICIIRLNIEYRAINSYLSVISLASISVTGKTVPPRKRIYL